MAAQLEMLFSPFQVRGLVLKNRLVMPPMHTVYGSDEGTVTQQLIDHYVARAKGGVALIIQEATSVRQEGRGAGRWLCIAEDASVPGWRELVDAVHIAGAKMAIQLHHAGGQTSSKNTGLQPMAPSPWHLFTETPHIMTSSEIVALEDAFAEGARRALAAGYDLIELHGAHGYLFTQFMSPLSNHRDDEYGGDLDGRLRFARDVIAKVRQAVGPDFPLSFRFSADEFLPGGITLRDSQAIAPLLIEAGADVLHVSAARIPYTYRSVAPMEAPQGHLVYLAAGIKQVVSAPVIAVGRIVDPAMAEEVLRAGKADLVAMGRALFADPDLPKKAMAGLLDDIRPCIGCYQGCRDTSVGRELSCLGNVEVGRDRELALAPATEPKKVVVIGGGPAGLEAARVAALRGHRVTLFEQRRELGGRLRSGTVAPGKQELGNLIDYLDRQVRKLGVELRLGETATPDSVQALRPETVVFAGGAQPIFPALPGIDRPHVMLAEEVLLGRVTVGQQVIVMGGGSTGCEVADYLAAQGKQVSVVTRIPDTDKVASDLPRDRRRMLIDRLAAAGVCILTGTALQEIAERTVIVRHGDETASLPADSVVLAQGYRPDEGLREGLALPGVALHVIGDAIHSRTAKEAIREGAEVARRI